MEGEIGFGVIVISCVFIFICYLRNERRLKQQMGPVAYKLYKQQKQEQEIAEYNMKNLSLLMICQDLTILKFLPVYKIK